MFFQAKRQILVRSKFAFCPRFSKRCPQEAQHPAPRAVFWKVEGGKRTNPYKLWFFTCNSVSVRTLLLQPPPPGCSSSCAAHALAKARSERPSERQVRPAPTQAERCTGDVGAPTGAGPIDKLIWWVKIPLEHNGRPTVLLRPLIET